MTQKQTSDLIALLENLQEKAAQDEITAEKLNCYFSRAKYHGMQLAYMQVIAEIRKLNDSIPG